MNTVELVNKLIHELRETPWVLIVDDDKIFNFLLRDSLELVGARVDVATDTKDARDKIEFASLKEKSYDIVFVDLNMPPENGPSVIKLLKEKMPRTPVVVVTGYPDSHLVNEALKYGYLGLVSKPINFEELESLFRKHKLPIHV